MTIATQFDQGRAYRKFTHDGVDYLMYAEATKYTMHEEFGVVNAGGPDHSFTLPDGRVAEGYTSDPFFVQQYVEMWNETSGIDSPDEE